VTSSSFTVSQNGIDIDATCHRYLVTLDLVAKQNRFHLVRVKKQPVC